MINFPNSPVNNQNFNTTTAVASIVYIYNTSATSWLANTPSTPTFSTVTLTATTASTSTTTGALIVTGGVGIGGNLTVGGIINADINVTGGAVGSLLYQSSANTTDFIGIGPSTSVLQSNGSTATWTSLTNPIIAGLVFGTQDNSGNGLSVRNPAFLGTATFQNAIFAGTVVTTSTFTINSTVASNSTLSGAIVVAGGMGIGGDLNAKNVYTNGTQILPTFLTQYTALANQATFTVTNGYSVGYIQVYANGVLLSTNDYTATNSSTVILSTARKAGDVIQVQAGVGFAVTQNSLATGGTINGNLDVQGNITKNSIAVFTVAGGNILGDTDVNGLLTQAGIQVLTVTGGTITGNLTVSGNTTFNSSATINSSLNVTGSLKQNGTDIKAIAAAFAIALS